MTAPIIGITAGHSKSKYGLPQIHLLRTYVDATVKAGGIPLIIPPEIYNQNWQLLYEKLDGIILSGGADMDPASFNGEMHPTVEGIDSARDSIEISLSLQAIEDEKPILAICRGFQVLNVALGGTLYTHISDQLNDQIEHSTDKDLPRNYHAHEVKVEEGTKLAEILGETTVQVNSWHHQGAKDIPPQLKITAHSPDGLVEGMELPDHPFAIAVQWHPEWMIEDEKMLALFTSFIEACKK